MVLRAPIGGLYRHVMDLSEALSLRGHQIGLVMDSATSDAQTDARLEALSIAPALGVHKMPISRLLGPHDLSTTYNIRKIAREQNVDVLHGHGAKGGFNARLTRMGSRRTIAAYTTHGGVLNYNGNPLVGKALLALEKIILPLTDAMIFESAYVKKSFEAAIGPPPHLSQIVYNGLAPSEFVPLSPDLAEFDFSFVGELRAIKGVDILLRALVDVRRANGEPATLIIAGAGPDEDKIRALIEQLNLNGRVDLAGVRPARQIFARAHCVVMPSLAESLPYVALEAAAAAKPLLATNVGGVKEIFGPTANSLLPPSDVTALKKAMQATIDNPQAAASEMKSRLEWVKANFSMEMMTSAIEDIYYKALDRIRHK
ncbi:hypothetical protein MNBD_ALPHA12-1281 [hydrothermal vent metagenome]|uniref:Glycosyltransferase n=1 Tax=hydrothermal vent metagenome TaxID=652676 RepID=A0A3B0TNR5_9ZZZZ